MSQQDHEESLQRQAEANEDLSLLGNQSGGSSLAEDLEINTNETDELAQPQPVSLDFRIAISLFSIVLLALISAVNLFMARLVTSRFLDVALSHSQVKRFWLFALLPVVLSIVLSIAASWLNYYFYRKGNPPVTREGKLAERRPLTTGQRMPLLLFSVILFVLTLLSLYFYIRFDDKRGIFLIATSLLCAITLNGASFWINKLLTRR
ncbi:hypothetical protein EPA93_00850 [Ktedonosporobacter rubrisoli]|uniref:Uncharacterized protein n=1 Tax=Ktedonosporobacter rubrisoli TaxID=2509675 RepID=A0A4P6JHV1_KTERU|nr:hypothetical protein [Ktedonosporobacter rubrisoli]QBD74615.1 hypothetical protein EPA93_00850 [Ktedonosporobacter rubrisoli]